jgi:Domain of unknown function (DUF3387)
VKVDPKLAAIAHELVDTLRNSGKLRVDWSDHASSQAAIRRIIKRLLRKHHYEPPAPVPSGGGGGAGDGSSLDYATRVLFEQARTLYRYWPDVGGDQLFEQYY